MANNVFRNKIDSTQIETKCIFHMSRSRVQIKKSNHVTPFGSPPGVVTFSSFTIPVSLLEVVPHRNVSEQ